MTDTEDRSALAAVASTIAGAAEQLAGGARRMLAERPGARVRRVRRMATQPLSNLWDLHPEARNATMRELEPRVVPVEEIAGTAVEGPVQRGGDFLPVRDRRGADWRARWQRILNGIDELALLPPVDLVKFGDRYWVVDGHNRVAAALYSGQLGLDANVVEARMPGVPAEPIRGNLAPYLEGSLDVREAGRGRLARTTSRPDQPPPRITDPHEE
jgi:hypothetical protein